MIDVGGYKASDSVLVYHLWRFCPAILHEAYEAVSCCEDLRILWVSADWILKSEFLSQVNSNQLSKT